MTGPDVDRELEQLWLALAPVARSRVEVLEQHLAAPDDPALRSAALQAAHRLAGVLGSYGRPGSDQAARLEQLLAASGQAGTEVRGLVAVLRRLVG